MYFISELLNHENPFISYHLIYHDRDSSMILFSHFNGKNYIYIILQHYIQLVLTLILKERFKLEQCKKKKKKKSKLKLENLNK